MSSRKFVAIFGITFFLASVSLGAAQPLFSIGVADSDVKEGEPFLVQVSSLNTEDYPQQKQGDLCYNKGGVDTSSDIQIGSLELFKINDEWSSTDIGTVRTDAWVYAQSKYPEKIMVAQRCNDKSVDFEEIPLTVSEDNEAPEISEIDVNEKVDAGETFDVEVSAKDSSKIKVLEISASGDGTAFVGGFEPCGNMYSKSANPSDQSCRVSGEVNAFTPEGEDGEITIEVTAQDYQMNENVVEKTVTVNKVVEKKPVYVKSSGDCDRKEVAQENIPENSYDSLLKCLESGEDDSQPNQKEKVNVWVQNDGNCVHKFVDESQVADDAFEEYNKCVADQNQKSDDREGSSENEESDSDNSESTPPRGLAELILAAIFG